MLESVQCVYTITYPLDYAKVFKPVDIYRVIPEPNPGVLVSLPDDRPPKYTEVVSIGRGILLQRLRGGIKKDKYREYLGSTNQLSRVIDVPGQCAVDLVHPYRDIRFNFEHRAVFAFRNFLSTAYLDVWRANSSIPIEIANVDCDADFAAVTEDDQFFIFWTRHKQYTTAYSSPSITRSHMMPTDLDKPARIEPVPDGCQHTVRPQSVVEHFFLFNCTRALAVLSTTGLQRLLTFFHAKDGAIKSKFDALDALIRK